MISYGARKHRRRIRLIPAATVAVALLAVASVYLIEKIDLGGDISNPNVEFVPKKTVKPQPSGATMEWPLYGFDLGRTRALVDSKLKPPFKRHWSFTGSVLIEFPPIFAGDSLVLLKNSGAIFSLKPSNGRIRWKRKLGNLAASSPLYYRGLIYVTLLEDNRVGTGNGRVIALNPKRGRVVWSKPLASRSESSPIGYRGKIHFGTESGKVLALDAKSGKLRWSYQAGGAVKGGIAYADGRFFFGDYGGNVQAISAKDGHRIWRSSGGSGISLGSGGRFYSTAAVQFGRVYIGSTDGRVYSFSARNGTLAWAKQTGSYVYASPAVADVKGLGPTVYIGSYDGSFYALNARTGGVRWRFGGGRKISGAATIIGRYVYFSDLDQRTTYGLGTNTGRVAFRFGRGAFNPVIADEKRIYLTGYSSVYAFQPK